MVDHAWLAVHGLHEVAGAVKAAAAFSAGSQISTPGSKGRQLQKVEMAGFRLRPPHRPSCSAVVPRDRPLHQPVLRSGSHEGARKAICFFPLSFATLLALFFIFAM